MKYSTLKPLLEDLEMKWFAQLQGKFPCVPPALQRITNGYSQFFSIEDFAPSDENVPVVVAVGINYDQGELSASFPSLTHWQSSRPPGTTWVVDNTWPQMRRALAAALAGYLSNSQAWVDNRYASSTRLLPSQWHKLAAPQSYILAMTNISPFLSQKQWTSHTAEERRAALSSWDPNSHICDLIGKLGAEVDLWVVHGIDEVWPRFNTTACTRDWILTPNLSQQNLNSGCIGNFWKSGRKIGRALPQWPICPPS